MREMSTFGKRTCLASLVLAVLGTAAVVAFASSPAERARAAGVDQIRGEADRLISAAPSSGVITDLPPTIAGLQPKAVHLQEEGVYIVLSSFYVTERGIFVLSSKSAFAPAKSGDPAYIPIAGRVYEYRVAG